MKKSVDICVVCIFAIAFVTLFRESVAIQEEIRVHPVTQSVLPGKNATFNCAVVGQLNGLTVNGRPLQSPDQFEKRGIFVFQSFKPVEDMLLYEIQVTVLGSMENNATTLSCIVYGTGSLVLESESATLLVAGPPSPPKPKLTAHRGRMTVTWNKPYSMAIAQVTSYNISVVDSHGQRFYQVAATGDRQSFIWKRPSFVQGTRGENCDVVTFEITAVNVVGESSMTSVSGGFPMALDPTSTNWGMKFSENEDRLTATVTPPLMCSYQEANYTIVLADSRGTVLSTTGPFPRLYGEGTPFTVDLNNKPQVADGTARLIVDPTFEEFESVEFETEFNCCDKEERPSNETETVIKTTTITVITSKGPNRDNDTTTTVVTETTISTLTMTTPSGAVVTTTSTSTTTTTDSKDSAAEKEAKSFQQNEITQQKRSISKSDG